MLIVSHSEKIAVGITELARQMAPTTRLVAAGGTDDGGIGTSFDRVSAGVAEADTGDGVIILCDLGSAVLTAETVLDFLDDDLRARVRIAEAPVVEGAVAAAVAAESGDSLDAVVAAAQSARDGASSAEPVPSHPLSAVSGAEPSGPGSTHADAVSGSAVLVNAEGLHARPASEFVRLAGSFDARVTVNGVDAKSLLRIMALGLTAGDDVTLMATGPDATAAVDALRELVRSGFGER